MRTLRSEKPTTSLQHCPITPFMLHLSFAGPVAQAGRQYPIPSRTRPSNSPAPMVLCLKTRESRSSPGPQMTVITLHVPQPSPKLWGRRLSRNTYPVCNRAEKPPRKTKRNRRPNTPGRRSAFRNTIAAGWSSPVARQAHNLKVAGSNPAPATRHKPRANRRRGFCCGKPGFG